MTVRATATVGMTCQGSRSIAQHQRGGRRSVLRGGRSRARMCSVGVLVPWPGRWLAGKALAGLARVWTPEEALGAEAGAGSTAQAPVLREMAAVWQLRVHWPRLH